MNYTACPTVSTGNINEVKMIKEKKKKKKRGLIVTSINIEFRLSDSA